MNTTLAPDPTGSSLIPTIERSQDGTPVISSVVIAEGSGVQHKNVLELLEANRADFEQFGGVAFETRTFETAGGPQNRRIALLNEQQATLLMTYQRNTEQVKRFKVALVKAFYELARPKLTLEQRSLALITDLNNEVQRQAAQIEAQAPLVAQAETYSAGRGKQTRQQFARDIAAWAQRERGIRVLHADVMDFLSRKLGLFITGKRSDAGEATTTAIQRGLADTNRGTAPNGHNFSTGYLTPQGVQYAWERCVRHIDQHGTLEIPTSNPRPNLEVAW